MDDISTLVWLGIGVVWILTRLIRGGVKKANRELGKRVPPPRPAAAAPQGRFEGAAQPDSTSAGKAKPIEPR